MFKGHSSILAWNLISKTYFMHTFKKPGPNFMALFTVSTESTLTPTEAGNYVLMASVFHGLAVEFWLLRVRTPCHFTLTRLVQKLGACT